MRYEKVGLWGISKGAELALTAGSLLPKLVNAVIAVAPMNTVCQGFVKEKGVSLSLIHIFYFVKHPVKACRKLIRLIITAG